MTENHPFTIKIDPHANGARRYRWSIFESGMLHDQSVQSYATIREADADANKEAPVGLGPTFVSLSPGRSLITSRLSTVRFPRKL
jgi:hypothetical protein